MDSRKRNRVKQQMDKWLLKQQKKREAKKRKENERMEHGAEMWDWSVKIKYQESHNEN